MDQRTDPFIRKFRSAQPHLGAEQMQDIVSLKYRDDCVNDSDYSDFIDHYLRQTLGLAGGAYIAFDVCAPRTRATSLPPRPIRGLFWLLNGRRHRMSAAADRRHRRRQR